VVFGRRPYVSHIRFQPRVAGAVLSGIIRIQIDEATPDKAVADLEYVAP
jgi:hypothetical protein